MDGVFRKIERIAQCDVSGGKFDLRSKCLFRAGGKHDGTMSAYTKLELTKKPCVIVKKADIGRAGWIDVAGDSGGKKCLAIDQREIVDFARLERLISHARFNVRVGYRHQTLKPAGRCWLGAHATAGSSGKSPAAGSASATISWYSSRYRSAIASREKFFSRYSLMTAGAKPIVRAFSAISSADLQIHPETPLCTISATDPPGNARTGVP